MTREEYTREYLVLKDLEKYAPYLGSNINNVIDRLSARLDRAGWYYCPTCKRAYNTPFDGVECDRCEHIRESVRRW